MGQESPMFLRPYLFLDHEDTQRTPKNYYFDQRTQNTISIDIEIELSDAERTHIIKLLPRYRRLFSKVRLFKKIRYRAEMEPTIHTAVGPSDITEEEFYISDGNNNYIKIIHHKIENGIPRRYCVDLGNAVSTLDSIEDFASLSLPDREHIQGYPG
ncbi:MAG: hypothetical protein WAM14_07465 [Candidatus Nitrosopolaris sp.]